MLKFLRYGHELDIFIKILSTRFGLNGISLFIWQITIDSIWAYQKFTAIEHEVDI